MAGTIMDAFKFGIGAGFGLGLINILFMVIGMIFFIPGLLLLIAERKKPKDQQTKGKFYTAYALMILGCVIGVGFAAGFIFTSMMENL